MRILIAEDEENIVVSLKFLFESAGFETSNEGNGKRVLEHILSTPPDLVVLDVMLPDLDGFDILAQLRKNQSTAKLPILMLTAKGQREDRKKALELGADAFISKPFSNAELVAMVHKLAGDSETRK